MRHLIKGAPALMVALVLAAAAQAGAAAKNEFRLSVYGMVCNQCAYGVEQALQHTEGVRDTIVDLKHGRVRVLPEDGTLPSVEALARRVTDQRVSIKEIEATLTGRLVRAPGGWRLAAGSRDLDLEVSDGLALEPYEDRSVVVTGTFAGVPGVDGFQGSPRLVLQAIDPA